MAPHQGCSALLWLLTPRFKYRVALSRGAARTGVGPGAIVSTLAKNGTDSKSWRKERLFGTVKAATKAPGDDDDNLSGTILMYDNTSSIPQIEPAVHAQRWQPGSRSAPDRRHSPRHRR